MKKFNSALLLLCTGLLLLSGCGGKKDTTVSVTGVSLNPLTLSFNIGESGTFTAAVTPENATNPAVSWASSNEAVATVSEGVVSGLTAGTATITVTTEDGGFTASGLVTVIDPKKYVRGIGIEQSELTLWYGFQKLSSAEVSVTFDPVDATDQSLSWVSDNESVATIAVVDGKNVVTAVGEGSAKITATSTDGGFTASCDVIVKVGGDAGNSFGEDDYGEYK